MGHSPSISIITVVYNAGKTLEKTIQSIINQTYKNIELIIIDGRSTDETIAIIKKYEAYVTFWQSEADQGIYDAMNKGLKFSGGDYVTFLNAGDYYCNNSVLSTLFSDNQGEDVIYGDIFVEDVTSTPPRYQQAVDFNLENLLSHGTAVVCHQAFFIKRNLAPDYNTSFRYKAELNWYFDIVEANKQLNYMHKDIAVVCYSLGGFGYINYRNNLYEWCKLIIKRYGLLIFFKYKYPGIIFHKLNYRYQISKKNKLK